jgi:RimJ/RimL family protein N-acetyltransferase
MRWAEQNKGIERFVATVAPDNLPSKKLLDRFGFRKIGGHVDDIDGLEDVYLRDGCSLARDPCSPPSRVGLRCGRTTWL